MDEPKQKQLIHEENKELYDLKYLALNPMNVTIKKIYLIHHLIHLQMLGAKGNPASTDALFQAWEIHSNYTNAAPSQQAHLFSFQ